MPRPRLSQWEWECAQTVFSRRQADEIRSFLQRHANCIHHTNHVAESTLIYAIRSHNILLADVLLKMGANVQDGCHWKNIQHSPLFVALTTNRSQPTILQLLIDHGANVNREINGMTILERLIRHQDESGLEPLRSILAIGADPNRTTTWTEDDASHATTTADHRNHSHDHRRPKVRGPYLIMAMATGQLPSAQVLLQHPTTDVKARDSRGRCALAVAMEHDFPIDWIHSLLDKRYTRNSRTDDKEDLPLELAVRYERTDIVRLFLQKGADPLCRIPSSEGGTVFELACGMGSVPIIFEFLQAHPTMCLRRDDDDDALTRMEDEIMDKDERCENTSHLLDDQTFQQDSSSPYDHEGDPCHKSSSVFPLHPKNQDDDGALFWSCHSHLSSYHTHSFEWEITTSQQQSRDDSDSASFFTCSAEEHE